MTFVNLSGRTALQVRAEILSLRFEERSLSMGQVITAVIFVLLLFGSIIYFFSPGLAIEWVKRVLRWRAGLTRHEVQVDDHLWTYLDGGEGEVILFVHGYGMEKDGWDIFARRWRRAYRLMIPDLPGFGETTKTEMSVYDVPNQVKRLDRFVNVLAISSFHLVGISMGGAIAAYYAGEHPAKVKSLFLMAPAGVLSRVPSPAWRDYREEGKIVLLYKNAEQFDALLDAVFYRKPFLPRSFKRYFADKGAADYRLRGKILRDLEAGGVDILEDRLHKVQAPSLVIWGENDQILHVSGAEKFRRGLRDHRVIILKECGHVVFFDRPEATRQEYHDFLQRLKRT
jgi:abhydrolase domain-containing protein 6